MTRLVLAVASGIIGLLVCIGIASISQYLQLTPRFPAPGGEDDFSFRAALFFFGMCPAFAVIGVWIAARKGTTSAAVLRMWGGAVAGSFVVVFAARAARHEIEALTADGAANAAAVTFFVAWVVAAALGAYLLRPRSRPAIDA